MVMPEAVQQPVDREQTEFRHAVGRLPDRTLHRYGDVTDPRAFA